MTIATQLSSTASDCTTPITNCIVAGSIESCVDTELVIPGSPEITKTAVLDGSVIQYDISGVIPANSDINLSDKIQRQDGP
jgi:hypothetical protein